jgi:thiol-disulfide isomerase/thioredoxin
MAVEDLTDETFETRLRDAELSVVDFYAGWCGPCMLFKPKFRRISDDYPHVKFFVCDGERAPNARKTVTIANLPYFAVYRQGEFLEGLTTTREEGFREFIEKHFGAGPGLGGGADSPDAGSKP